MDYVKDKIKGTVIIIVGIVITIYAIFWLASYPLNILYNAFFLTSFYIIELILGIALIFVGIFITKPIEKVEKNKKIGYISAISGGFIIILSLIGPFIVFQYIDFILLLVYFLSSGLLLGIILIIIGRLNIKLTELDKKKSLGYAIIIMGVFLVIPTLLMYGVDILFIMISGGISFGYGSFSIKKATPTLTDIIQEVKEESIP